MTLWDWVVRAHAAPGADTLCLKLQDEHGQSVSYLLWAAWAAAEGRAVDAALLGRAADLTKAWEQRALGWLRSARRGMKAELPGIDAAARQTLRARIAEDELAAERLLLESLEAMTPASKGEPRPFSAALILAASHWDAPVPHADLESLSRIFEAAGS